MRNTTTTVVIAAGVVLAALIVTRTPAQRSEGLSGACCSELPNVTVSATNQGCLWDCGGDFNGDVGIVDFLALLAQWGGPGSCDFNGGGVGINDFLELLAHWGPCP